jgi:hypothetical protein
VPGSNGRPATAWSGALGGLGAAATEQVLRYRPGDIVLLDAVDLSRAVRRRKVSCVEVMTAYLDHIEALNPSALSMSATPAGRVLAGFVSNGVPWLVTFSPTGTNVGAWDPTVLGGAHRIDYLPVGAGFPDALHAGEWYAGVGWVDQTSRWAFAGGNHAVFIRDGSLP